jgi:hypothetical protein
MSSANQIPDDVQKFINDHINSLEQLEVLLLLKNNAAKSWTADEVSRGLFTSPESAAGRLKDLAARGFLVEAGTPPAYTYQPPPDVHAVIAKLEQTYKERRISVINLIFSKPIDKIRTFSDAFRLRKKDDE